MVNFFLSRLTEVLKINFNCFKKVKNNFLCCKTRLKVLEPLRDETKYCRLQVNSVICSRRSRISKPVDHETDHITVLTRDLDNFKMTNRDKKMFYS